MINTNKKENLEEHKIIPPVSFYFSVKFLGPITINDMAFFEVSGLTVELETQEIDLGGGNKRIFPIRQKHGNLICKRPLRLLYSSALSGWVDRTMRGGVDESIVTCDMVVQLLNAIGEPQCAWSIKSAYPVKWDIAGFDSKKNEIVLETIEFAYDTVTRMM